MSEKFLYMLLLLILIIIISQTFSIILSLPILREGLEQCLPSCDSVTYDSVTNTIPPCSKMNIQLLSQADATKFGIPIIQKFKESMDTYINTTYNFNTLFLPLKNDNITIPSGLSNVPNINQIIINSFFGDISGIHYKTNQDILDNMCLDSKTNDIIKNFKYSLDINSPNPTIKQNVITTIEKYKTDSRSTVPGYASIYTKFLNDMLKMCVSFDNRCPGHYTESNLKTLIEDEIKTPKYYGSTSSFHKVSEYVYQGINGTLGTTTQ